MGGYGFLGALGGDGASGTRSDVRTLLRDLERSRSSLEPDFDRDREERLSSGLRDILANELAEGYRYVVRRRTEGKREDRR